MRLGIYVHFPFCLSKCPYCDFASEVAAAVPHRRYARAIAAEAAMRAAALDGQRAASLYLGGGTPSLWDPRALEEALAALSAEIALEPSAEITLEANPGASDARRFAAFRKLGINRLSIGVQSFHPQTLAALGRRHTGVEAERAYLAAREAGFDNVSLDLIYGATGQTVSMARDDAARAAELSPEHLSCYALTLEPEALAVEVPMAKALRRGRLALPDEDAQVEMGEAVRAVLDRAGYRRYEISNFAREGRVSRHNSLYWTGGAYLGLGAGASGTLYRDPARPRLGARRYSNHRSAEQYLAAVEAGRLPEASSEELEAQDLLRERLAMGLRMADGLDLRAACAELEGDAVQILPIAQRLCAEGLGRLDGERFFLTERGLDLHTEVAVRFI